MSWKLARCAADRGFYWLSTMAAGPDCHQLFRTNATNATALEKRSLRTSNVAFTAATTRNFAAALGTNYALNAVQDIWDPNTWDLSPKVLPLYLDDHAETFVLLDEVDYWWAVRWRWHINKPHRSRPGKKRYACRSPGGGGRYKPKLYLHVQIMKRTGILPPTPEHTIADHRDGNEFNCVRENLRWATPSQNNYNRFGARADSLFAD